MIFFNLGIGIVLIFNINLDMAFGFKVLSDLDVYDGLYYNIDRCYVFVYYLIYLNNKYLLNTFF